MSISITVTQEEETVGAKKYPLTVTRQRGLQEIMVQGKPVLVESVTIFESPLGTSLCYTRAQPPRTEAEKAERLRIIREVATRAMIDQGIW